MYSKYHCIDDMCMFHIFLFEYWGCAHFANRNNDNLYRKPDMTVIISDTYISSIVEIQSPFCQWILTSCWHFNLSSTEDFWFPGISDVSSVMLLVKYTCVVLKIWFDISSFNCDNYANVSNILDSFNILLHTNLGKFRGWLIIKLW